MMLTSAKTRLAFIQKKPEEEKPAKVKQAEKERVFELGKLKIQLEMQKSSQKKAVQETNQPRMASKGEVKASVNNISFFTFESLTSPKSLIVLKICGVESAVCADTGASHSIAGEKLFHLLQRKKEKKKIEPKTISLTLADGTQSNVAALTTIVNLEVEGKVIPTELIVLPEAKGNRTLLVADSKEKVAETSSFIQAPKTSSIINLRSEEGKHLIKEQRNQLNSLLQSRGEPTSFIEHRINTGISPPVAEPPYRMNPAKKELLKKELDTLLASGIIEECESPYASPVVLVPKPNGSMRLCVDFSKI
ncbi:hypothetical protein HNY73_013836 [Argiope bruennichi]|uniref:Uncharacterized protein n=1 Tax=Argiope bruennichi TaxID=94029 RepID=A0A8T0ESA3_ARGBR|nr:hypothetical protein HNY73_013836 [Argiope bruennichi]